MIVFPILAQRLLIDMRKVDYMGPEPVASKLLFAPQALESGSAADAQFNSFEMDVKPDGIRYRSTGNERGDVFQRA